MPFRAAITQPYARIGVIIVIYYCSHVSLILFTVASRLRHELMLTALLLYSLLTYYYRYFFRAPPIISRSTTLWSWLMQRSRVEVCVEAYYACFR